jgi:hypothetical protein
MVFMRVSLVELPCQAVMEGIPALEYVLSGMLGLLQPRPIMPGAKCHYYLRP